jgi:group I intron endonuclease
MKMPAEKRWSRHIKDSLKNNSDYLFNRAICKYGPENFSFEVICQSKDGEYLLQAMEPYFIKKYNSLGISGYNSTEGGRGVINPSPETREKKRKSMMGKNTGNKNGMYGKSPPNKGKRPSDKQIEQQRLKMLGRITPGNIRKKQSLSNIGKHSAPRLNYRGENSSNIDRRKTGEVYFNTGEILKITGLTKFAREYGYPKCQICRLANKQISSYRDIVKIDIH